MLLKTILNRVYKFPSFVFAEVVLRTQDGEQLVLEVEVRPRTNSRPICSTCGRRGPGYDTGTRRRFDFVPMWAIPVLFIYAMRRVDCSRCGVRVERVPWAAQRIRRQFHDGNGNVILTELDNSVDGELALQVREFVYDAANRRVAVIDALGVGRATEYDKVAVLHIDRLRSSLPGGRGAAVDGFCGRLLRQCPVRKLLRRPRRIT